jgi:nitroimidazol reductase NimA-like FMN-containing flavoprotein (pyridoxamine 5'-phosphate oxidase superfamily)
MPSPRMTEDEIWATVAEAHTGILTTLRRDGNPIALPLWFVCLDRRIYAQSRGKKLARIEHDPRASFLVESGYRWAELKAVHLIGTAHIVELDDEIAGRFRDEFDRKYAGARSAPTEMPKETANHYRTAKGGLIEFIPAPGERVLNWDNANLFK